MKSFTKTWCTAGTLLLLAMTTTTLLGCGRIMTAAELQQYGTRPFPGRSKGQVMRATVLALRTLGYDVTMVDRAVGRVKTAPHVVQVAAVGNRYSAYAIESALAWTVDVSPSGDGSVVHAVPRAYSNGQALDNQQFSEPYMEKAFGELFREIESDLPGGAAQAHAILPPGGGSWRASMRTRS